MPAKATLVVGLAASRWAEHRPGGDPPPGQPARPADRFAVPHPGGPGDSGVAAVTGRGEALDAMTDGRFDIVGWDPAAPVGARR
jgi:hypothetical protein